GRMLSERLARWQFWLLYVGFLLTFGTMHITGVLGMPRRIYTYDADRGWALVNQLTTLRAIIQAPSFVLFVWNVFASVRNGRRARTRGTPGRWSGPLRRHRPCITLPSSRRSTAAGRCGTSNTRMTRTGCTTEVRRIADVSSQGEQRREHSNDDDHRRGGGGVV